jgi:hypothetical protein
MQEASQEGRGPEMAYGGDTLFTLTERKQQIR